MDQFITPINLAVLLFTIIVSSGAAFGAGRLGAQRANEQAAKLWRDLAEARAQEVAEVRNDVARLKGEIEQIRDDKFQLRQLNAQLLTDNGKLRERVTSLEAQVTILTNQIGAEHLARLENEAARKVIVHPRGRN